MKRSILIYLHFKCAITNEGSFEPAIVFKMKHTDVEFSDSGFRRKVDENYVLLVSYAASNDNFLPKTSVKNYHYSLRNRPRVQFSKYLTCLN